MIPIKDKYVTLLSKRNIWSDYAKNFNHEHFPKEKNIQVSELPMKNLLNSFFSCLFVICILSCLS